MKFSSIAYAATMASVAMAKTVYVTRLNYVTVDADGNIVGQAASIAAEAANDANNVVVTVANTYTPTTLLTVAASYSSAPVEEKAATTKAASKASSTSSAAAATSTASSSSNSGIYAEIASSGADADFAKTMLDLHNAKRALHSAGDLSWDADVYKYAQAYADKYQCGGSLVHSGGQYGENLALGTSTFDAAFNMWYEEGNNYDYSSGSFDHFTAVIWKGTTKLGCAYKKCDSGSYPGYYIICSYDPAGNVVGQAASNLFSN